MPKKRGRKSGGGDSTSRGAKKKSATPGEVQALQRANARSAKAAKQKELGWIDSVAPTVQNARGRARSFAEVCCFLTLVLSLGLDAHGLLDDTDAVVPVWA